MASEAAPAREHYEAGYDGVHRDVGKNEVGFIDARANGETQGLSTARRALRSRSQATSRRGGRQSVSGRRSNAGHRAGSRSPVRYHGIARLRTGTVTSTTGVLRLQAGRGHGREANVTRRIPSTTSRTGSSRAGFCIDIPRLKGVPYLEPGTPIYVEDLEAWEKTDRRRVSAGDALVRAHRRVGSPQSGRAVASRPRRRRQVSRSRSVGHPLARSSATSRFSAATIRNTSRRRTSRARFMTSRCCIWACISSTIWTWRRSVTRRLRAIAGSSC